MPDAASPQDAAARDDHRAASAAGILFAMPVEADAFAATVSGVTSYSAAGLTFEEGTLADRRVAWCVSGAGADAAARATRLLIDGHRPRFILSAGFAGGLDPTLRRGTVAFPRQAIAEPDSPPIDLLSTGQGTASQPSCDPAGRTDRGSLTIVSVTAVITTAAAKRDLARATGASLVDMETYAVATAAAAAGLTCGSIRVISDDATQDLPREIAALVQPQSGMRRLGAALGAIGRRPRAALDMWQLWEHAVIDGRTLATAIRQFLVGPVLVGPVLDGPVLHGPILHGPGDRP